MYPDAYKTPGLVNMLPDGITEEFRKSTNDDFERPNVTEGHFPAGVGCM